MGAAFSALSEMNPLSVAKDMSHDLSVYVLNSCKSQCDCCGCWRFGFQTFETHDDSDNDNNSINITWNS